MSKKTAIKQLSQKAIPKVKNEKTKTSDRYQKNIMLLLKTLNKYKNYLYVKVLK